MKERGIIMSAPMVHALLAGTKTQTRRLVKLPHNNPLGVWELTTFGGPGTYLDKAMTKPAPARAAIWHTRTGEHVLCPHGESGDRLWVRETWREDSPDNPARAIYRADFRFSPLPPGFRWKPAIHMPRWASRITLEILSIRAERLQDISAADAIAEGIEQPESNDEISATDAYRELWLHLHGPGSWETNPWIWRIEFKRAKPRESAA